METLAEAVGISRSTVSRFFSGKSTSLAVTLKILGVLQLRFDDVAQAQIAVDDASSSAGAAPDPRP